MSLLGSNPHTPLQKIEHPLFQQRSVELYIKREDLIHPQISGNKWYKLKYNLLQAKEQGISRLVSFGGAFSNHLHALAYAGQQFGFETVGFVRGERVEPLNPTLADAERWGMELVFLNRSDYRRRYEKNFVQQLTNVYQPCLVIPEGGANKLALMGCTDIVSSIDRQLPDYDYLCVPCGTGSTLSGLVAAVQNQSKVLGFSALKGAISLKAEIAQMIADFSENTSASWQLIDEYHCGGFGKISVEQVHFMQQWQDQTGVALDPIYTSKMLMGVCDLLNQDYFKPDTKIVAVHTGGMQGLRGMQQKIDRLSAVE